MKTKIYAFAVLIFNCTALCGQAPGWEWAKSQPGNGNDIPNGIATDADGNSYITGSFSSSTLTFGTTVLTNPWPGKEDVFVAKYDASGNVVWAKRFGANGYDYGNAVAVDTNGNLYVTGTFRSLHVHFDNIILTNAYSSTDDIFIAKFDTLGNVIWAKSAGAPAYGYDLSYGITADANGNSYITGYFSGIEIHFDSITLVATGLFDFFIAKYDSSGNVQWAKTVVNSGFIIGNSIAVDANGNVYATGDFDGSVTFGSTPLGSTGYNDVFVVKYDSSGNVLWAKQGGGGHDDNGQSITVDANGNSYITGHFGINGSNFGGVILTGTLYGGGLFVAKYDSSGNVPWATTPGGNGYGDIGKGIKADPNGNLYVTGHFSSDTLIFGNSTLINVNGNSIIFDIFIAKYDSSGNALWAKNPLGQGSEYGHGVDIDASGNCYITGYLQGQGVVFGTTTLSPIGGAELFIAKTGINTGITEENNLPGEYTFTIFPNPGNGETKISYPGIINEINIRNVTGQIIYTAKPVDRTVFLKLNENAGIYFVTVRSGDSVVTRKWVLER
ncbi:MAG TPA: SBBP repeat-containing protein [Bacteroidia bacterium]|nr:SBBP repeat-containing protein [Bacteroidia bacterium]